MARRALISCVQMLGVYDTFADRFHRAGVEVDLAEVSGQQLGQAELLPIIDRYDGILAGDDELTGEVLSAATRLKVISRWGIGMDSVDLAFAASRGITVTNTPGVFDDEVADVTIGYLIMLARSLHQIDQRVRHGEWPKIEGRSLAGSTLGVVGLGGIGRATARRAMALRMRVVGTDPSADSAGLARAMGVEVVDIETLLATSDAIALNCPLNEATRHLLNADTLDRVKPGVLLVNTARGPVVHEQALVEALRSGRVGAAALDVYEVEPLASDNPLRTFDQVILGSHNASNTKDAVMRTSAAAVDNLLSHLGGAE